MGGGGSSAQNIGDLDALLKRAREELRKGEQHPKRNVFISFDHEDLDEVNLLRGQAKNEKSPLEFNDWSVSEPIDSDRAPYIKLRIAERIAQSSLTVVYLSDRTSTSKWVEWEIRESIAKGKHVIGVYARDTRPSVLPKAITENRIKCVPWRSLAATIDDLE